MRIDSIKVKNFRGYKDETRVEFGSLTLLVGKNDVGKSTVLEAADIFFGNRRVDIDDLCIDCDPENDKVEISIEFSSFPLEIDIDSGAKTSLSDEFLLNLNGKLEVKKIYSVRTPAQPKVFLKTSSPLGTDHLISFKNSELKSLAQSLSIDPNSYTASINNSIRKVIWKIKNTGVMHEIEVDISKEDGKKIYEKLEQEMPVFTLFSVDRKNTDQDDEIQAPIKASIKELLKELAEQLEPIRIQVLQKLDEISEGTIRKLEEMNPEVAKTLKSVADKPAWEKAFSINIESDGVPLNKRGSGVKRLVLINFFRHEADRKRSEFRKTDVFYAIEEPETSQHPDWQVKLFDAFRELTGQDGVQIAVTSHHPELCGLVPLEGIRFFQKSDTVTMIKQGDEGNYKEISKTLGVLPKLDGVKAVVGVEGPNDIEFLKNIAKVFGCDGDDDRILWIPMGGGTLRDYVDKGYLSLLKLPQIHIFDRDADSQYIDSVTQLKTQGHWAELTSMRTLESYIHPKFYKEIWPTLSGDFVSTSNGWLVGWSDRNIPEELSEFVSTEYKSGNKSLKNYGSEKVKRSLAKVASKMTDHEFKEMGTFDELKIFFDAIQKYI